MDFIPFNSVSEKKQKNGSFQSNQSTPKNTLNSSANQSNFPAFGSPAIISYGGNQIPFGSPAMPSTNSAQCSPNSRYSNQQFTPRGQNNSPRSQLFNHSYSPRSQNSFSPRQQNSYSPRHQNSFQFTPSPYNGRNNSKDFSDGSNFKTPHQFSPGRGRGGGRKSFTRQFDKTPRFDPNCNAGGSSNIEDYFNPGMLHDPWLNLSPVIANPR